MAKYTMDFDFTPTWENAQELLLDLAGLVGQPRPEVSHADCICTADHLAAAEEAKAPLLKRIEELEEQNRKLFLENEQLRIVVRTPQLPDGKDARFANMTPRLGEMVKILPHPGYEGGWTTGVVKGMRGVGGSKGVEVLPKNHPTTVIIERKYLKRFAANERAEVAAPDA